MKAVATHSFSRFAHDEDIDILTVAVQSGAIRLRYGQNKVGRYAY